MSSSFSQTSIASLRFDTLLLPLALLSLQQEILPGFPDGYLPPQPFLLLTLVSHRQKGNHDEVKWTWTLGSFFSLKHTIWKVGLTKHRVCIAIDNAKDVCTSNETSKRQEIHIRDPSSCLQIVLCTSLLPWISLELNCWLVCMTLEKKNFWWSKNFFFFKKMSKERKWDEDAHHSFSSHL